MRERRRGWRFRRLGRFSLERDALDLELLSEGASEDWQSYTRPSYAACNRVYWLGGGPKRVQVSARNSWPLRSLAFGSTPRQHVGLAIVAAALAPRRCPLNACYSNTRTLTHTQLYCRLARCLAPHTADARH